MIERERILHVLMLSEKVLDHKDDELQQELLYAIGQLCGWVVESDIAAKEATARMRPWARLMEFPGEGPMDWN